MPVFGSSCKFVQVTFSARSVAFVVHLQWPHNDPVITASFFWPVCVRINGVQLYSATRRIFNFPLGVWKSDETRLSCLIYYEPNLVWCVFYFCFQLTQQKRTKNVSLFDHSSPFMKMVMYTSLGILLTLVFLGTLYDLLMRRNWARCKQDARISGESLT